MSQSPILILLVEDSEGDARLLRMELSTADHESFRVTWLTSLAAALDALKQSRFDALLLDLNLPDCTGLETLARIREMHEDIPIVVLSGNADEELALQAVSSGAQDYLVKGHSDPSDVVSRAIVYAIERSRMLGRLRSMAITDELTGVYNRRGFETLADQHLRLARRNKKSFSLFFADVDGLKAINDRHGHGEGDFAIRETAELLTRNFRESDIVARMGGDEFVILAIDCSPAGADALLQRVQDSLNAINAGQTHPYALSVSIGATNFESTDTMPIPELLKRADAALYDIKQRRERIT
ncbi:MAG: GGDEF domain-containing response regulator [Verrucomicrobia bacterium]|nr:GGDEF domain-containing response regulator [Verrucomicrobiota bacterium]